MVGIDIFFNFIYYSQMADNSNFEHDLFISYARLDNKPLSKEEEGWIYRLHYSLKIRLGQLLGREPKIWRDEKLQGNDEISEEIISELCKAKTLLAVISPRYLASKWCMKELHEFLKAAETNIGVHIGNKSRIFKVVKTYVHYNEHPSEIRGLNGYQFYELDENERPHEFNSEKGSRYYQKFWERLEDVVWDICLLIKELEQPAEVKHPENPPEKTVYLAETTSDMEEDRENIRRDLTLQGYTVLPDRPLPYLLKDGDFRDSVREYLMRCKLSIHLIGNRYGPIPEDEEQSIVELQNDLAAEQCRNGQLTHLINIPPRLDKETGSARQYEYISALQNNAPQVQGTELLKIGLEDFKTVIQDTLGKINEPAIEKEQIIEKGEIENPFPGLRPFEPNESFLFFGRNAQSDELLRRLDQNRFLAVVGTSGSGKSSLVRAGLLPNLYNGFTENANAHWRVALFRPGTNPIGNLAEALGHHNITVHTAITEATLRRGDLGLVEAVRQARLPKKENLLVVVDQFEELFRFKDSARFERSDDNAAAFVKLLLKAVGQTEIPIYIVITMRSDFLGDCARFRDLPEAINDGQYLVPRMTRDQRREAITGPVAVGGAEISPRLVQRLLNDVGDNPDQLPILQHALMRTWNYWLDNSRKSVTLDVLHYEKIGGMEKALSIHADEAYDELTKGQTETIGKRRQELVEKVFRCITALGSDNREIRRPTLLKDICKIVGTNVEELKPLIEVFRKKGRSFLIPSVVNALDGDSLVDISHESLIRQWDRLRDWVKKESEDREMYERIADAAQRYDEGKGGLFPDIDLQFALEWQAKSYNTFWAQSCRPNFNLGKAVSFLGESKQKRDAHEAEQKERKKRELSRRNNRILAIIISMASLISIAFGIFGWQKGNEAHQERYKAQQKAYDANYNLAKVFEEKANSELKEKNYQKAWLYTLAALNQDIGQDYSLPDSFGRLVIPEIYNGTYQQIWAAPSSQEEVYCIAVSPAGKLLVSGGEDKTVQFWDIQTGKLLATLEGHSGPVKSLAISPDGKLLVSGGEDHTVRLWDIQTRKQLATLEGHSDTVKSVAISPDGKLLASGGEDKTVRLWDIQTRRQLAKLGEHLATVSSVVFSPDGKQLASGGEGIAVQLWDVNTGEKLASLEGHLGYVESIAFSPDGKLLASGGSDNTIRLWDTQTRTQLSKLDGHSAPVSSVVFSPDGKRLASGSSDRTMRIWDIQTEKLLAILDGHSDSTTSVTFSPDGKRLASASIDKTVRLWDTQTGKGLTKLEGHIEPVTNAVFSPDGKHLVLETRYNSPEGEYPISELRYGCPFRLWDVQTGKLLATLDKRFDFGSTFAFSPDGKQYTSVPSYNTVLLCDVKTRKRLTTLEVHYGGVHCVAFSPDGKRLATGSRNNTVRLWDIQTGKQLTVLKVHSRRVTKLTFSPDGKVLATDSRDYAVGLWDIQTGKQLTTLEGHSEPVTKLTFSPDGKYLATGSEDYTVRLWDVQTGKQLAVLEGHSGSVIDMLFSPNGKLLASGARDDTVRLWDVQTKRLLATRLLPPCQKPPIYGTLVISPDGQPEVIPPGNQAIYDDGRSDSFYSMVFNSNGILVASGGRGDNIQFYDLDYLNHLGMMEKRSSSFKKIYKTAFDISPYSLESFKLVMKKPVEYQTSLPPRPPDKKQVEWILENVK